MSLDRRIIALSFLTHIFIIILICILSILSADKKTVGGKSIGAREPKEVNFPCGIFFNDRTFRLEDVNKEKYLVAKKVALHPLFSKHKDTQFFIACDESTNARNAEIRLDKTGKNIVNAVFFSPLAVRSKHFQAMVAHELSHIWLNHKKENVINNKEADRLAKKVVGRKAIKEWREDTNFDDIISIE